MRSGDEKAFRGLGWVRKRWVLPYYRVLPECCRRDMKNSGFFKIYHEIHIQRRKPGRCIRVAGGNGTPVSFRLCGMAVGRVARLCRRLRELPLSGRARAAVGAARAMELTATHRRQRRKIGHHDEQYDGYDPVHVNRIPEKKSKYMIFGRFSGRAN